MNRKQRRQKATLRSCQVVAPASQLASNSAAVEADLASAIQHLQAGQLDRAEAIFKRVLAAQPSQPVALHLLGVIALQAGRNETAADLIGKALAFKPDYAEAHNNLGSALMGEGKAEEAVASYQKAITLRPDYAKAHINLGVARTSRGELDEAVAAFRKAIALAPSVAQVHNNLGSALMNQGKLDEAIDSFQTAIALEPDYAEAHYNLGNALKNQDQLAAAVVALRKTIALEPDFAAAHNSLGIALNDQGMHEEAIASYQKAVALKPSFAEAHSSLGNALKDMGRLEEAVASQQRAIALRPDFAEAHNNLALALERQGQLEAAQACYEKAIALKPDYAAAHYNLGFALDRQGKLEAALAWYQKAIALKPDIAENHHANAVDHTFFPGDPEIAKLQKLVKLEGLSKADKSPIFSALGKAHDDIGRYREAFSYYSTANEEMARRGDFDPSRHRKEILEIKEMFRERRDSADQDAGDAEHVPVFVVGMSRSGKTSVEALLVQHEDAYGTGESYEWLNAVKAVLDKYSISPSFPEYMGFLSDDHLRKIGEMYMENIIMGSPDSRLFINTSPVNYKNICLILQALPMARIIYCHRDPMDHCLFIYFFRYKKGHGYSYDLSHLASYYADYCDIMAHWQRLYGDCILSVRYEDLVRNPNDVGARIYAFCGLDCDPAAIRHAFTSDEIGRWKHYEPYLGALRQALGGLAK